MIGELPTTLTINGREIPINTDFRVVLCIFQACNDRELSKRDMAYITLDALYGIENLAENEYQEAAEKAKWFLDGGRDYNENKPSPKTMDWEQDEQMIFSAVNNVARQETRALPYLHWWTFLGYFNEIREGLFSNVLMIRQKKAKHKKLEPWEQDYYKANKDLIDFHTRYTDEEKAEKERLNQIFQ